MSKSSRKLLITAGCSNTDPNYSRYKSENVTVWPYIVADELNCDLINLGVSNSSNDSIAHRLDQAMLKYKDLDPIVCVFWTDPTRMTFFGFDHIQAYFNKDVFDRELSRENKHDHHYEYYNLQKEIQQLYHKYFTNLAIHMEWSEEELDIKILDYSLESILRCSRNYNPHFALSLSLIGNIPMCYSLNDEYNNYSRRIDNLSEYLEQNEIIKELNVSKIEWKHGWVNNFRKRNGYLLECGHPNQKGQNAIAEEFLEKIYADTRPSSVGFIYD